MCSLEGSGGIHPVFFFIMLWWFWGSLGAWWHSSCLMLWSFWWSLGRLGLPIGIIWPRQNTTIAIVGFWDGFLVPFWDIWDAMGHPVAPLASHFHHFYIPGLIILVLSSWCCIPVDRFLVLYACVIFLVLYSWFYIPGFIFLVLYLFVFLDL